MENPIARTAEPRLAPTKLKRILLWCFLLLPAFTYFGWRGPAHAIRLRGLNDFTSPFVQTKAWLRGLDPYDPRVVVELWPADAVRPQFLWPEAQDGSLAFRRGIPSPYPLPAFPLLVPLALITWRAAILIWIGVCMIAFAYTVRGSLAFARIPCWSIKGGAIAICALLFSPFHTSIAAANIVVPVLALGVLSCLWVEKNFVLWPGLLLAAAVALKPNVAPCFVLYLAAEKKWRTIAVAVAAGVALFLIADARLLLAGVHPAASYLLNSHRMFAPGAIDDYSSANPLRFDLLNLQVVFFQLFRNRTLAQVLSWLSFLGLLACWTLSRFGQKAPKVGLLDMAILATLVLLPVYHRFTDGCLLLFPFAWAITEFNGRLKSIARLTLLLASFFVVPGAALLRSLASSNSRVGALSQTWWWQSLVAPHQVWIILAIAVLTLTAQGQTARQSALTKGIGDIPDRRSDFPDFGAKGLYGSLVSVTLLPRHIPCPQVPPAYKRSSW